MIIVDLHIIIIHHLSIVVCPRMCHWLEYARIFNEIGVAV